MESSENVFPVEDVMSSTPELDWSSKGTLHGELTS